MPIAAPATTSLIQCMLFIILDTPVSAATVYPPMLNQGLLQPYSLWSMVAVMKDVAVCPEGNECFPPFGLSLLTIYLIPLTVTVMIPTEKASDTSIPPHFVRLSYPAAFIPSITAAGAYWVKSSYI